MNEHFINLLHKHAIDYEPVDSEEIKTNCPECADDGGHFYVNTEKQVGFCHRCSFAPGRNKLHKSLFGEMPSLEDMPRPKHKQPEKPKSDLIEINLPPLWQRITEDHPYMIKRRIDDATIKAYNLGYCDTGPYAKCLIIPTYMDGILVNWIARDMLDKRKPKYLYPGDVKQAHCLFNYDRAKSHSSIAIVEGAFDAMRVGFNAVALGRKRVSRMQTEFLLETKAKSFFIMLDGDALMDAVGLCEQLGIHRPTYLCQIVPERDPDDLSAEEIREAFANARFYTKALKAQIMARQAVG